MNAFPKQAAVFALSLIFAAFAEARPRAARCAAAYTVALYDSLRRRPVALAVYPPGGSAKNRPVVLFSHGYGQNAPDSYRAYSYLTRALAAAGYFVVSIQHELPGDEPLAMEGDLYRRRLPNWERGVQNILFTMGELKKLRPGLDWNDVTVIGHSNGGDMAMLLAAEYPQAVRRAVSLDNRRMPLPRTPRPRILTLRGCDYPADEGVLPDEAEQGKHAVTIVRFDDIRHGDMDDKGNPGQHARICRQILDFMRDRPVSRRHRLQERK